LRVRERRGSLGWPVKQVTIPNPTGCILRVGSTEGGSLELPVLLAGPILRRTERRRVCVWVATSRPVEVTVSIHRLHHGGAPDDNALARAPSEAVAVGPSLFAHLAVVEPAGEDGFPTDELLAYDVAIEGAGLGELASGIAYHGFSLPTFFIRERISTLNVLHGSCRLLHGKGEDAFGAADHILSERAHDPEARPSALFLTGDQIYGDQVAGPLIRHLDYLGRLLVGEHDDGSVPGVASLSATPVYGREAMALELARFTSDHAENHLMSFGEFAAMYVTAWNESAWPREFLPVDRSGVSEHKRKTYEGEVEDLERARAALPQVRRVLANIPTYMIFDDHDVTDDWNITREWCENVNGNPTGRRVVANALAAFWTFQGWGNQPEAYDSAFKETLSEHLTSSVSDGERFDRLLWSFDAWSFFVPTDPPAIVLDTRTQRSFDSPQGAARLIGAAERKRVVDLIGRAGHRRGGKLILVSPVPLFGLELQERRQKFLVGKVGPYEIDFEAWHSNLQGFVDFMMLLVDELGVTTCVLMSGDVHYGLNAHASFVAGDKELTFEQLVSSSFKHGGTLSRAGLDVIGTLVTKTHQRVGWDKPPRVPNGDGGGGIRRRVIGRAANTDEWAEDAPVFLAPRRARQLGIEEPPDYQETRTYVRPEGRNASILVGENNVGLVSVGPSGVVHQLHGRRTADKTRVFTARMKPDPSASERG
jgi:hypothetical protein